MLQICHPNITTNSVSTCKYCINMQLVSPCICINIMHNNINANINTNIIYTDTECICTCTLLCTCTFCPPPVYKVGMNIIGNVLLLTVLLLICCYSLEGVQNVLQSAIPPRHQQKLNTLIHSVPNGQTLST